MTMSNALNQCDLLCPVKVMLAANYRHEQTRTSNPLVWMDNLLSIAIPGLAKWGRSAATCPSRELDKDHWKVSPSCAQKAQAMADSSDVKRSQLDGHQQEVLQDIRFCDDQPTSGA